jgi:hypothetical protein
MPLARTCDASVLWVVGYFGCEMKEVSGRPDPKHVSTSFVERQNWTIRGTMRRYTRLSNGFYRKLANHAVATALNYFWL